MKLFSEKICQEIETLKFKKHLFGIKLKEFYFNLIFCEEDLGKYGNILIEIVTLLFRFNCDLKPAHFSKFYSPLDTDFVRKYAKMAIWGNNLKCQNQENQEQLVQKHGLLLKQIHQDQHVGQVQVIKSAISQLKRSHLRVYEKNSLGRPKSISLKWEHDSLLIRITPKPIMPLKKLMRTKDRVLLIIKRSTRSLSNWLF